MTVALVNIAGHVLLVKIRDPSCICLRSNRWARLCASCWESKENMGLRPKPTRTDPIDMNEIRFSSLSYMSRFTKAHRLHGTHDRQSRGACSRAWDSKAYNKQPQFHLNPLLSWGQWNIFGIANGRIEYRKPRSGLDSIHIKTTQWKA